MSGPRGAEHECGGCNRTFAGLSLFDAHRTGPWTSRRCRSPVELGLAQDARGTWCTPEGLQARESLRTRLAQARSKGAS